MPHPPASTARAPSRRRAPPAHRPAAPEDRPAAPQGTPPPAPAGQPLRLLVLGRTRSGKSTALHRLARTALAAPWAHILIADGKGPELGRYASPAQIVYEPEQAQQLAAALASAAKRLSQRYAALRQQGLAIAPPGAPRELIIIDEVQEFTRHPKHGKVVRAALIAIFEKSAALGDVVILTSQRATGAVPPAVRYNASAQLHMLGGGFYQLVAEGQPAQQGRIDPCAPLASPATLCAEHLPAALCAQIITQCPTLITRYEGAVGSGRTYALSRHSADPALRRILLDAKSVTHRELLITCLQECGAAPPENATICELADAAALALRGMPTLLLIDNVDSASAKAIDSIHKLLDAAHVAAITLLPADQVSGTKAKLLAPIRRRASLVALQPLDDRQSAELVHQIAPNLDPASQLAIINRADGNPRAITAYAERIAAHGDDERHQIEPVRPPGLWLNLLLMFVVIVGILIIQQHVANDIAGAILSGLLVMVVWYIRPHFRKLTKP